MSELIRVPDIGSGEGEVIELFVKVGDRIEAEQSLLKTALQERTALSSADSRVADTRRGFEANFVGLSKSAAELVCSKLQARQQDCVIVP